MTPPRSAFGASPPGGRPQRPGRAGSAASAWSRYALVGWFVAGCLHATAAADGTGRTPLPAVERAKAGTQCVEPADTMRRNHMAYLKHQRDDTVRGGVRGARYSLKACIDCHAGASTRSVNATPDGFCVSCHQYAAVKLDCFE